MQYLILVTCLLAPTYALRFNFKGLPLNLLMVWVFLVIFWLLFEMAYKKKLGDFWRHIKTLDKKLLWLTGLFFLASVFSLFVSGVSLKKLGQFLVLFVQPISLFFIFGYLFKTQNQAKRAWLIAAYLLLGLMGVWSIIQYWTLFSLPTQYWGNSVEPKRALGFFGHPNFYALFSAPLLAFLLPDLAEKLKTYKTEPLAPKFLLFWLLGLAGLALSMSRAGWLGLGVALAVFLFLSGERKLQTAAAFAGLALLVGVALTPNLRYRVLLPFYGEKSAVSRISLWETGIKGVKQSPLLGLGLTGFSNEWPKLNTDPNLDSHNFPHNIFLNLWLETGLLGLLSFVGIIAFGIWRGFRSRASVISFGVALFLIALLTQGQIDNPYFKNDLALIFWVILSLII
ncbi:MAG: O-antigen ligase family protein [Patescibacteria group bacterium]|nr:O-antigen ligase family protein [Patescibacteria group bacterium]